MASLLLLAMALFPAQLTAQEDTLNSILERIRVPETRHFSYWETRYLRLLAKPWRATGDMYISAQQMVIAQHSPTFVVTSIAANQMLHFDAEQNMRRKLKLEQPFAVPGMEPLLQLLYGPGRHTELEQQYVISLDTAERRWLLQLAPRQHAEHDIIRLQIYGENGQGPDRLALEYEDGDRKEWRLSLLSQGTAAARELQQILGLIH